MDDVTRFLLYAGLSLIGLISFVVVLGLLDKQLDPGIALGVLGPLAGGIFAGIAVRSAAKNGRNGNGNP